MLPLFYALRLEEGQVVVLSYPLRQRPKRTISSEQLANLFPRSPTQTLHIP